MVTKIIEFEKPKLKNPIFIEGLPGVGNVGRIAAGYLAEQLKMKKFADLTSSHFMPFVLMHQSSAVHVLKNEFYYYKAKNKSQRDMIVLVGDSQSIDPEGHYEIVYQVLDLIKKYGTKEMFTLAGLTTGEPVKTPKVVGAVSDPELVKKFASMGIDFESGSKVGTIVGASGLLLGLGKYYGIKGVALLGETVGYPIIPDPKAAEQVLRVLSKVLKVEINMKELDKKVKEIEEFMKKMQNIERQTVQQLMRSQPPGAKPAEEKEKLTYIG